MQPEGAEALQPELLITFGSSVISKNLKLFLRKHKPKAHWHLQPHGPVADTFQTLTRVLPVEPGYFFAELNNRSIRAEEQLPSQKAYNRQWKNREQQAVKVQADFFQEAAWGEFVAVQKCLQQLPANMQLHLANSMSVRYANFAGLSQAQQEVQVWANRGTSGIDGCTSTAVGGAIALGAPTLLITGDMAFIYDRNGLWHNFLPANLRILVLNNHGGGIFRIIDGPRRQPELEEFFETHQPFDAETTAREAGLTYMRCDTQEAFEQALPRFLSPEGGAKLLEVVTESATNAAIFKSYKEAMLAGIS